ncbi:hypothetical protein M5689_020643 [Euphorbia peplus]|nr:hypothetical protein M5689_020643 [Euphorbia peplus]
MATTSNYRSSLIAAIFLVVVLLPSTPIPTDATRFTHQGVIEASLKEGPFCLQCECCSSPPPGSCCDCCSGSVQPQDSMWP